MARLAHVLAVSVLVGALAGCGPGGDGDEPPEEQETAADEDRGEGASVEFEGEVLAVIDVSPGRFSSVEVHFIHDGSDEEIYEQASACVEEYADGDAAACYGYATREDYQHADVDEDDGGAERQCWRAHVVKPDPDARPSGGAGNPDYESEGCPGGAGG